MELQLGHGAPRRSRVEGGNSKYPMLYDDSTQAEQTYRRPRATIRADCSRAPLAVRDRPQAAPIEGTNLGNKSTH